MRGAFIGDVVGRPGRAIIKEHLMKLRKTYGIDVVIANTENASHGFGLTIKNATELFNSGIDLMTGGNHTWDKKEIITAFDTMPILRPYNYPEGVPGKGVGYVEVNGYKLAVINLMGYYTMPMCENPFLSIQKCLKELDPCNGIFIDFHAEATSEKRAMMMLLQGRVSAIIGTHTHVGTDDFQIANATAYLTDMGLTGCRDNVIGMDEKVPLKQFLTGLRGHFDIPKKCKKIMQIAIMDFNDGRCESAFKLKIFDDGIVLKTDAWIES